MVSEHHNHNRAQLAVALLTDTLLQGLVPSEKASVPRAARVPPFERHIENALMQAFAGLSPATPRHLH